MKKFLFAVISLLGLLMVFSCQGVDKDEVMNYSKGILGTWELVKGDGYYYDKLVDSEVFTDEGITMTLNKNGQLVTTEEGLVFEGSYSLHGNILTLHMETSKSMEIKNLSSKELVLLAEDDEEGEGYYILFYWHRVE